MAKKASNPMPKMDPRTWRPNMDRIRRSVLGKKEAEIGKWQTAE